jgi:threonine dehydratase
MIGLDDVRASANRIMDATRRTPMISAIGLKHPLPYPMTLSLKLELLQVSGSFKARGAISKVRTLTAQETRRGIITASGGNHGLAVAYAGHVLGVPAVIYLPENVDPDKLRKLEEWRARAVIAGATWDSANQHALAAAERDGLAYIHAFADPLVIAGQGTIALEILEQSPGVDTIVVAIGGGGLISGIAVAAKALDPAVRIVGVEPTGAPTLKASLEAGAIVSLGQITTSAITLAAGRTEPINFDIVARHVDDVVLVSDDEMRLAARWLWSEFGVAAELSGAASIAALMTGRIAISDGERVCALICGAGRDGWT